MLAFYAQIILESLPISSSGHEILLGLQLDRVVDRLSHGPTVIVLVVYFFKEIWHLFFHSTLMWRKFIQWGLLLALSESITVFLYIFFGRFSDLVPLWLGFLFTAVLLGSLFWCRKSTNSELDLADAALLGIAQGVARFPGISRLAITYVTASWLGYEPRYAFRISCALQVPLFILGFMEGLVGLFLLGDLGQFATCTFVGGVTLSMIFAYYLLSFVESIMLAQRLWLVAFYMIVPVIMALIG